MSESSDIFASEQVEPNLQMPLAAAMRPTSIAEFTGQEHLLAANQPLGQCLQSGRLHSMVLWGPPGCGKTTLAQLLATTAEAQFISISAVMSGVADIRKAVESARRTAGRTVLFVDEVHRFNKAQQDAFLPFVEDGTLIFIGATTENPSFELIGALLSRIRVYVLRPLTEEQLTGLLLRCQSQNHYDTALEQQQLEQIAVSSGGDARRAFNLFEVFCELCKAHPDSAPETLLQKTLSDSSTHLFDKGGDQFYEQISALHKSVRGSSPDAALYWLCRMLDGGCDPLYIARRVVRMASEDIGNADIRALQLALNAWEVQERLGSPEGELAIAQAIIYLASTVKSNACYKAFNTARTSAGKNNRRQVPTHLRNAPTQLMKDLGYGQQYRYAHDEPDAFAAGETYFPAGMTEQHYYQPVARGMEIRIGERLAQLRELNRKHRAGSAKSRSQE